MSRVSEELLSDISLAIVREVSPERIYLFGSQARGGATKHSDVDLLIVEKEPFGPNRSRREEMTRLGRLLASYDVSKDILVFTVDEVEKWRHTKNHVIARALREGRLLYERA